jgi:hypothetical protein
MTLGPHFRYISLGAGIAARSARFEGVVQLFIVLLSERDMRFDGWKQNAHYMVTSGKKQEIFQEGSAAEINGG